MFYKKIKFIILNVYINILKILFFSNIKFFFNMLNKFINSVYQYNKNIMKISNVKIKVKFRKPDPNNQFKNTNNFI